jgi:magnesium-transporting ATPase (P-type)
MVKENEIFPCDLVILITSLPKGLAYVETRNLDGETNLKLK